MNNYLNNALQGWARPDEETYRVRGGAFTLSLEQFRYRSHWENDTEGQFDATEWDDYTYHCTVQPLVYDAFAYLAAVKPDTDDRRPGSRPWYWQLEQLAQTILDMANTRNEAALIKAAEEMAALTPYWAVGQFAPKVNPAA